MIDTKDCLCIFRRICKNCLYGVNNAVQRSCHVSCKNKQYFGQHEVFFCMTSWFMQGIWRLPCFLLWRPDSCRKYNSHLVFDFFWTSWFMQGIWQPSCFFMTSWFMQGTWQPPCFFLWRAYSWREWESHLIVRFFPGIRCTRQSGRRLKN